MSKKFAGLALASIVAGFAWALWLGGLQWEALFWLRLISTAILAVVALLPVMKKIKRWSENESSKTVLSSISARVAKEELRMKISRFVEQETSNLGILKGTKL